MLDESMQNVYSEKAVDILFTILSYYIYRR